MTPWARLGIEPTRDIAAIKRAYARRLKVTRPEDDPRAFQALVEARDTALAWVRQGWVDDGDEDDEDAAAEERERDDDGRRERDDAATVRAVDGGGPEAAGEAGLQGAPEPPQNASPVDPAVVVVDQGGPVDGDRAHGQGARRAPASEPPSVVVETDDQPPAVPEGGTGPLPPERAEPVVVVADRDGDAVSGAMEEGRLTPAPPFVALIARFDTLVERGGTYAEVDPLFAAAAGLPFEQRQVFEAHAMQRLEAAVRHGWSEAVDDQVARLGPLVDVAFESLGWDASDMRLYGLLGVEVADRLRLVAERARAQRLGPLPGDPLLRVPAREIEPYFRHDGDLYLAAFRDAVARGHWRRGWHLGAALAPLLWTIRRKLWPLVVMIAALHAAAGGAVLGFGPKPAVLGAVGVVLVATRVWLATHARRLVVAAAVATARRLDRRPNLPPDARRVQMTALGKPAEWRVALAALLLVQLYLRTGLVVLP